MQNNYVNVMFDKAQFLMEGQYKDSRPLPIQPKLIKGHYPKCDH